MPFDAFSGSDINVGNDEIDLNNGDNYDGVPINDTFDPNGVTDNPLFNPKITNTSGGGGGLNLNQGLTLSALAGLLGTYANQQGVKDARDLLTQYGAKAVGGLDTSIANQKEQYGANAAQMQANTLAYQQGLKKLYEEQQGIQRPYQATGTNALSDLGSLGSGTYQMYDAQGNPTGMGTGSGYLTKQFDKNDLAAGLAPNYDFMLQQGQMANQRAANMGGGGFGGNALTGLNRYTQDYAGNAYQNAFTNYQNQRQNIFGNLSKLADVGQTANNQLLNASNTYGTNYGSSVSSLNNALTSASNALQSGYGQYGTNYANLATGLGQAQAQNAAAGANLNAGALQSIGNTALLSSLLGQKGNVTSGGGGGGGGGDGGILDSLGVSTKDLGAAATIAQFFSDERMKENIEFIKQMPNGINIYNFDYKPEFKDLAGHGRFIGVMAQEIEKFMPSAVKTMFNGYKAVDYSIVFPEVTYG
jgi:hypothetical protein